MNKPEYRLLTNALVFQKNYWKYEKKKSEFTKGVVQGLEIAMKEIKKNELGRQNHMDNEGPGG